MKPKKRKINKGKNRVSRAGSRRLWKILVIHGPNLNLLGQREVGVYGHATIKDINAILKSEALSLGAALDIFQSNHEGEIVDRLGRARSRYDAVLINPAAYTHTSVAIRDSLMACSLPAVEVHLSNIYKREEFRHQSLTAAACIGQVSGFGTESYILGLNGLISSLKS